jgi:hypothetical protein
VAGNGPLWSSGFPGKHASHRSSKQSSMAIAKSWHDSEKILFAPLRLAAVPS